MSAPSMKRVVPELDRMRNLCYQQAKQHLERHPASRKTLQRLQEECPHVSGRDLLVLFHLEDEALVQAAAHRMEYNATHPRAPPALEA